MCVKVWSYYATYKNKVYGVLFKVQETLYTNMHTCKTKGKNIKIKKNNCWNASGAVKVVMLKL